MIEFFNLVLYQPLLNILVFLYNIIPGQDLGIAIILLTTGIKLILYPLYLKQLKAQKAFQDLQPQLNKLKEKYKNNREAQAKAMMEFYKKQKINPVTLFLPLLIQLPILIALYRTFIDGLNGKKMDLLYPFIKNPGSIDPYFLNLINLSQPNFVFAVVASALQFWQSKMFIKKPSKDQKNQAKEISKEQTSKGKLEEMTQMMNKQMLYFFPLITFVVALKLPAALPLYWIVVTLFTIIQQYAIIK